MRMNSITGKRILAIARGGSLVFANTLYRAKPEFFANPQWAALGDWQSLLQPHYATAERMLGMQRVPHESDGQALKPFAYYLADESSLTCYTDPFDVDWAPEALAAFRRAQLVARNPRVAIDDAILVTNREIARKLEELGYTQNGVPVRPITVPTIETIRQWMDEADQ